MLQILLTWIYIFITSYCAGRLGLGIFNKWRDTKQERLHPVLVSLAGLVLIMVVAGYLSVFIKTGLVINIIIAFASLLYIIKYRKEFLLWKEYTPGKNIRVFLILLFLAVVRVLVLVKASGPITTPDSGAYHLPFIRWIENYKAIKGLANVHSRFGFNYQYHVLCAVYGFSFLHIQTVHALNGYLMVMLVTYLATTISYTITKTVVRTDVLKLIALFFVLNMSNASSSFSPDFPATALILFVILLTIERIEKGSAHIFDTKAWVLFMLSVGAVLFKISSLPVLLFTLFYILPLFNAKRWQPLTGLIVAGVLFAIPYLIRNYIISGYLIYPLYSVDIFDVPWKVPYEKAVVEKNVIRYYALGIPYGSEIKFPGILGQWWQYLRITNRVYIYIIGLLMFCVVLNIGRGIFFLFRKNQERSPYRFLFALLYICLIYWWWNAPDPRFGNGYIIVFIAINIAFSGYILFKKLQALLVNGAFIVLTVLSLLMIKGKALSKVRNNFNTVGYNIISQQPYPQPSFLQKIVSGNKIFYKVPDDDYCWDAPQPCSLAMDKYDYIGNTIEEGFKPALARF